MRDYEGLNLSELLALMHDTVVPAPVPWVPATPGWWILAAWMAAVVLILGWAIHRHRRRNRYRREALAMLDTIAAQSKDAPVASAGLVAVLLKRTALAAYPRSDVAALHGAEWSRFLARTANNDTRVGEAADRLAAAAYRPDADGAALIAPARRWIKVHRA